MFVESLTLHIGFHAQAVILGCTYEPQAGRALRLRGKLKLTENGKSCAEVKLCS